MAKNYLGTSSTRKYADGGMMGGSPMPGGDAAMSGAAGGMPPMEGGGDPMAGGGAPPEADPNDPMAQVDQMVGEWVQSRDPGLQTAICEALAQVLGYTDGGGGQPAPAGDPAAMGGAPAPMGDPAAGGGAPMFKRGGKAPMAKGKGNPFAKKGKSDKDADDLPLPKKKAALPAGFTRRK